MLKQFEVFLVATIFIFISTMVLIVYTMQREQQFIAQHSLIQKSMVDGAAYAINLQLSSKQRHVRLFSDEYGYLLQRLSSFPRNTRADNDVRLRLKQRFPDFFTYTITDKNALPKLFDIDSHIGKVCKNDLINFVKDIEYKKDKSKVNNKVLIHPQPEHYHYDVMAPLDNKTNNIGIFFVSFHLDKIAEILKTHELPGNELILLRQSDSNLIEVTSAGTRDKILSRVIRLSQEEINRLGHVKKIPNSDWKLTVLPDPNYLKQYKIGIWKEAGIILAIEIISIFTLLLFLPKRSGRRIRRKIKAE